MYERFMEHQAEEALLDSPIVLIVEFSSCRPRPVGRTC